ncbi:MAG: YaaW family protein [Nodosilinea sp.]
MDELRSALELATEEELQALTEILFRPKFNPLDYFCTPDPLAVQSGARHQWINHLEQRFRFLAADGLTVLHGQSQGITYRQVLLQVCRHLKLPYANSWSTADLESEIFLYLLQRTWQRLPDCHRDRLQNQLNQRLSPILQGSIRLPGTGENSLGLWIKGSTAIAVNTLLQALLQEVGQQSLVRGGSLALGAASREVALGLTRYGATRTALAWLGPTLWTWFLADLGWRAIATNYGRVIPAVFSLAQIRLLRDLEPQSTFA